MSWFFNDFLGFIINQDAIKLYLKKFLAEKVMIGKRGIIFFFKYVLENNFDNLKIDFNKFFDYLMNS